MRAITKYLSSYAETECHQLGGFPGNFLKGLVVPVYNEAIQVVSYFREFAASQAGTLIILVVNRPDSDPASHWYTDIFASLSGDRGDPVNNTTGLRSQWHSASKQLILYSLSDSSSLLLVDRCRPGRAIPEEQGVGLARKIGNDILCTLILQQKVTSHWMSNTDADVQLPSDYFAATNSVPNNVAAVIYPFQHVFVDQTPQLPTLLYEFSLHYYVAGLRWAGSANAYHTIGSLVSVHFKHYCQVRGFPKRPAAEDFYLLNKLLKTGEIRSLQQPKIDITARESSRVPFGTGPAVIKINALTDPSDMFIYHPDSFVYLHYFLKLLTALADDKDTIEASCQDLAIDSQHAISRELLLKFTSAVQLDRAVKHCYKQGDTSIKRLKHLIGWFDGFKTLKLIHFIRDNGLGMVTFRQWQEQYRNEKAFLVNKDLQKISDTIDLKIET